MTGPAPAPGGPVPSGPVPGGPVPDAVAARVAAVRAATARVASGSPSSVPASERVIEVPAILAGMLPDRGLRRGSTVTVGTAADRAAAAAVGNVTAQEAAPGGTALALALLSAASGAGSWCGAVGLPELGLVAAEQAGVRLDRLALVPQPGTQWAVVTAALLDGVELLLVRPPSRLRVGDARRLVARARERDAVLVVLGHDRWPEMADLRLTVVAATWAGLGRGHGFLQTREVEVAVTGRRAAARERRGRLWLPGPDAAVDAAPATPAPAPVPSPGRVSRVAVAG